MKRISNCSEILESFLHSCSTKFQTVITAMRDAASTFHDSFYILYVMQIYIVAEVLAVPALPLTASSGYLFGLVPGFLTVLASATIAASISFLIGRTLLRDWAQKVASGKGTIENMLTVLQFGVNLIIRCKAVVFYLIKYTCTHMSLYRIFEMESY